MSISINTEIECLDGHMFDPVKPDPDGVRLIDIAKGLAYKCRYAGLYNGEFWYSVAQHCVLAAKAVYWRTGDADLALKVLFHDAAEAYLQDIAAPIKQVLPDYEHLEIKLLKVIYEALDLEVSPEDWSEIKAIDREMYFREIRQLRIHQERYDSLPDFGTLITMGGAGFAGYWEREQAQEEFILTARHLSAVLIEESSEAADWMVSA